LVLKIAISKFLETQDAGDDLPAHLKAWMTTILKPFGKLWGEAGRSRGRNLKCDRSKNKDTFFRTTSDTISTPPPHDGDTFPTSKK